MSVQNTMAGRPPGDPKARARRDTRLAYVLLAPYLVLLLLFGIVPVCYAFGLSFFDTIDNVFWGLTNYQFALEDFRLTTSIGNVLTFVGIWVSMTIIGVTAITLMLDAVPGRPASAMRTLFFLPGAITSSAIVVLWLFLLDPAVSPFQGIYQMIGWQSRFNVISGIGYAGVFALMAFFANSGGWIVVLSGAVSSLPQHVMEAARIDGANRWQLATRIKLPMIWRSVALMGILSAAAGLQMFVEPQLLMLAGAEYSRSDWSVNQLAFQYAFSLGDFGISAALSSMMLLIAIAIALTIVFATRFYKMD